MVFPRSFVRHTLMWALPDGEEANCRIHWALNDPIIGIDDTDMAAFAARGEAYWTALKSDYVNVTSYVGSRLQLVGTNGKVVETLESLITPVPGTRTDANLPTEVAVVVSLRTGTASRSGRGRIYLPAPSTWNVDLDGRYNHSSRDTLATDSVAYLQPLTVGSNTYEPYVVSTTEQALRQITSVRVGDVFDVQRRRRNQLAESYVTAAV